MGITDETFLVVDTETTGLTPPKDRTVEIGAVLLKNGQIEDTWESLINPDIPIPPEASAIHHLTDDDVAKSPSIESISGELTNFAKNASVIAAHNSKFDQSFLPTMFSQPWLCTCRLARQVWPKAPAHGNQVLRYWLKLDVKLNGMSPHRALPDAIITANILGIAIEEYLKNGGKDDRKAFMDYINSPITVQTMPFGMHYGKPLSEVPKDYLRWALENATAADPDLKWTIESLLKK